MPLNSSTLGNSTPTSPPTQGIVVEDIINKEIEKRISTYKTYIKIFSAGLFCFITIIIAAGLIKKENLVVKAHNFIFPYPKAPIDTNAVETVYSQIIYLKGDKSDINFHNIHFYATPGQKVTVNPIIIRLNKEAKPQSRVKMFLDNQNLYKYSLDDNKIGDILITDSDDNYLVFDDPNNQANIHTVGFQPETKGPSDPTEQIIVNCIIKVYKKHQ